MTGKEYQELAIRTCSIPYDQKEDRLFHAVFGLNSEAGEVAGLPGRLHLHSRSVRKTGHYELLPVQSQ